MLYVIKTINYLFSAYTLLLIIRVLGSWIPQLQNSKFMQFVSFYTDPYLNIFRRIIPPIGGVMDISPLVAFFALYIIKYLVMRTLIALFL
ncbi:MAG: YggT family protein [Candidatus Algichlamydia australiensis]|nr:YggT family protein [Chlamydiales bacterium]